MTVLVNDPDFTLHLGDVLDVLAGLPDESVHCVVTSPPYWGLRDYSTEGQLGLEPTPDQYVQNMVGVFREVRRVLRRDGTCWINLGDSYAGSGPTNHGGGGSTLNSDGRTEEARQRVVAKIADDLGRAGSKATTVAPGLKPKDLCGIPWRLAFALQQDGWYLRSEIIWAKPNPMPESVTDRPTKSHEQVFLLTRSPRYFYDADAVREPHTGPTFNGKAGINDSDYVPDTQGFRSGGKGFVMRHRDYNAAGRNLRSVWNIATEPYPDAHFATFPQALVEPCVKAGTSEHGCCPECGAPWERETEASYSPHWKGGYIGVKDAADPHVAAGDSSGYVSDGTRARRLRKEITTTGWKPVCECGVWANVLHQPVPCTVLDPFMGSGTVALVARRLGRRSIGIELNPAYAELCVARTRQLSLLAGAAR